MFVNSLETGEFWNIKMTSFKIPTASGLRSFVSHSANPPIWFLIFFKKRLFGLRMVARTVIMFIILVPVGKFWSILTETLGHAWTLIEITCWLRCITTGKPLITKWMRELSQKWCKITIDSWYPKTRMSTTSQLKHC